MLVLGLLAVQLFPGLFPMTALARLLALSDTPRSVVALNGCNANHRCLDVLRIDKETYFFLYRDSYSASFFIFSIGYSTQAGVYK